MKKNAKSLKFTLLYFALVIFDIVVGSCAFSTIRYFTKPLILISLVIYFGYFAKILNRSIYKFMILALVFSLMGDVLLLFDHLFSSFFIFGLLSFLVAHLLYCYVFIKKWSAKKNSIFWIVAMFLWAYGLILFFILKNSLANLKIPVIIYILGILAMAISAFGRKNSVSVHSFKLVFLGALLFVASDSILALNKFIFPVPWSHFLVMGTYASAQYLIMKGILKDSG